MMKHVRRLAMGSCLVLATVARAHPGHDGHELTWDMRHLAQHPLATIGCAVVVGAAIAWGIELLRRRAEVRGARVMQAQSLRASQARRGK